MPLYYKPFTATGHPHGMTSFVSTPNSWKVYLLCQTSDVRSCYIFIDRVHLQAKDLGKFKTMLSQLGKHCESGIPLSTYYDEKSCHPAFSFTHNGKEEKVWRIRQGNLRLYFIYLPPEKRIVLLHIWVKNTDKISNAEQSSLQRLAESVFDDDLSSLHRRIL